MVIKVNENRLIEFSNEEQGTSNEKNIQILQIQVPEKYSDFYKKIVFITDDGNYWDYLESDNSYTIKRNVTKYNMVSFYIWLTKDEEDFRSKTYPLFFNENEVIDGEITPEEETDMERVIAILEEEIDKTNNLDLDITKNGKIATVTVTKKDGTEKSVQISDGEKGDKGDDYVITQEDYQEIADIVENQINIPAKTSDLTNDSGFITKLVNDLSNYYLKSETYTKTEVNNLIGQIGSLQFQVVNELPVTGDSQYIYLVPSSNPEIQNIKDEYIWVNSAWEQIGNTQADLTGYATETWVNSQISNFLTQSEIQTLINTSIADKYTKPTSGIPKTDLASDVQTSLEKADTALQNHQDISGKEDTSNKVTSLSNSSTDTQYPSAKATYTYINTILGNIETLLAEV